MDIVGQLPRTVCFRDVFNPRGAFGINARAQLISDALAEHLGITHLDESDLELTLFIRNDPAGFMSFVEDIAAAHGLDWIGATLFPNHLEIKKLRDLVSKPDDHFIFMSRRPIDRAISLKKARLLKQWKHIDTTDVRVPLDVKDVEDAIREATEWFELVSSCLRESGCSSSFLSYEDQVQAGPSGMLDVISQEIEGFPWEFGDTVPTAQFKRQDRSGSPFEKIERGEDLRRQLERRGLFELAFHPPSLACEG